MLLCREETPFGNFFTSDESDFNKSETDVRLLGDLKAVEINAAESNEDSTN